MDAKFRVKLREYIANISIGSSTVRGRPAGTVGTVRKYLEGLDLSSLRDLKKEQFEIWLNEKTQDLQSKLTQDFKEEWGLARKCLNIFLRNVVYNKYLFKEYNLRSILPWLEVPLDSQVAQHLRNEHEGEGLPRWPWLNKLDQPTSKLYQDVADKVRATKELPYRVHLDVYYWRQKPKIKIK